MKPLFPDRPSFRTRLEMQVDSVEESMNLFANTLQGGLNEVSNAIKVVLDTKEATVEVKDAAKVVAAHHTTKAKEAIQVAQDHFVHACSLMDGIVERGVS